MRASTTLVLIFFLSAISLSFAQTHVSGEVWGTWTPEGNPYIVDSTIVVPDGQTLTLEPGVEVRIADANSIVVNGTLNAVGTETDSIFFINDGDELWDEMQFSSPDDTCRFTYCSISSFQNGIFFLDGELLVNHCFIYGDLLDHLKVFDIFEAYFILSNSTIECEFSYFDIGTMYSDVIFYNNYLKHVKADFYRSSFTAYENVFQTYGTSSSFYADISTVQIYDNNMYGGIRISESDGGQIYDNIIRGKVKISTSANTTVSNNQILDLGVGYSYGMDISHSFSIVCSDNYIASDGSAMKISDSNVLVSNNVFGPPDGYISIYSSDDVIFEGNVLGSPLIAGTAKINIDHGSPQIISNSIYGEGIDVYDGYPIVKNNIIYGYSGIHSWEGCDPSSNYNVIWTDDNFWGYSPGPQDLVIDPLFVGGLPFDFTLQPSSPCIDSGDPSLPADPDGSPPDRGAVYFDHNLNYPPFVTSAYLDTAMASSEYTYSASAFDDGPDVSIHFENLPYWLNIIESDVADTIVLAGTIPADANDFSFDIIATDNIQQFDVQTVFVTVFYPNGISGTISGVINAAGSPYIVNGNLEVPAGDTLTIEPGVELKFKELGIYVEDRIGLIVDGFLVADGTENDTIVFTSNQNYPNMNDWKGIVLNSSSYYDTASFKFCSVNYASDGIITSLFSPSADFRNTRVNRCSFTHCGSGVHLNSQLSQVDSCYFDDNMTAIYIVPFVDSSLNYIFDNMFEYNNTGVFVSFTNAENCSAYVYNNNFSQNSNCIKGLGNEGFLEFPNNLMTIEHNTLESQTGWNIGGNGIYIESLNCVIDSNEIMNNSSGINCWGSTITISHNIIENNYYQGISIGYVSGEIAYNEISGSLDAAAFFINECDGVSINHNILTDSGEECFNINFSKNISVFNNCIVDNSGIGIFAQADSSVNIYNNIITGNSGGGIYLDSAGPYFSYDISLSYNNVWDNFFWNYQGVEPGVGSISEDPLFIGNGDYHLTQDSPCIDTGAPWSPLDPDSTIADMGCYYFDPNYVVVDPIKYLPETTLLYQNYPNPFNSSTIISYMLDRPSKVDISIYNILGREVSNLVNARHEAGSYRITWKANSVCSGVYFIRFNGGGHTFIRKMIKLD